MTYTIENGVLIAHAETPEDALSLGATSDAIGTREQLVESHRQALDVASRWERLIAVYDGLA